MESNDVTTGSGIYRDRFHRTGNGWKIAHTEYDRIIEVLEPLLKKMNITVHHLARTGRKLHERGDDRYLITWVDKPACSDTAPIAVLA